MPNAPAFALLYCWIDLDAMMLRHNAFCSPRSPESPVPEIGRSAAHYRELRICSTTIHRTGSDLRVRHADPAITPDTSLLHRQHRRAKPLHRPILPSKAANSMGLSYQPSARNAPMVVPKTLHSPFHVS